MLILRIRKAKEFAISLQYRGYIYSGDSTVVDYSIIRTNLYINFSYYDL